MATPLNSARIVVADSNLSALAGVPSNVAIVNTVEVAVGPGRDTVLVIVQAVHDLEAINAGDLP